MASTNHATQSFTAAGAGTSVTTEGSPAGQVWVSGANGSGAFVGTAAIEVSLDGATFVVSSVSPLAAGEYKAIPELAKAVRINVTAYTSGELEVVFGIYTPQ